MAQGILGIQFEVDGTKDGVTGLGGLALCLEFMHASGLCGSARRELQVCGEQGWLDVQMLISALTLNLAGGDCVDDLKRWGGRPLPTASQCAKVVAHLNHLKEGASMNQVSIIGIDPAKNGFSVSRCRI